jgi:hypothetical protein
VISKQPPNKKETFKIEEFFTEIFPIFFSQFVETHKKESLQKNMKLNFLKKFSFLIYEFLTSK